MTDMGTQDPEDLLAEIRAVVVGLGRPDLLERLDRLRALIEEELGPRARAEVRIRSTLATLLAHEIARRELMHRGRARETVLGKWQKEIEHAARVIGRANQAKHFASGRFFTADEIERFSAEEIEDARGAALVKLFDFGIEALSDPVLTAVRGAADLGFSW